jgi:hypothetical protein
MTLRFEAFVPYVCAYSRRWSVSTGFRSAIFEVHDGFPRSLPPA